MSKSIKKISSNLITAAIISIILLALSYCLPLKIVVNLTESLPQKYFLIIKGKLPEKGGYAYFKNDKTKKFYTENIAFTKQVIGISGDLVKEVNNNFWIFGEKESITFGGLAKEYSLKGEKLTKNSVGIIPPNHYYVYAPHKDSLDSRYKEIGLIHESDIIGKAIPLNLFHLLYFVALLILLFLALRKVVKAYLKLAIIALITLNINPSYAKDLGVYPEADIYDIIETDLSADIKNKLTNLEESGELKKLQKEWQKQAIQRAERPKAVEGLSKAIKTREFIYDPSVTSNKDIYDHQGNIVVKQGTKVNPLHYQNLPQRLLFINGDDKDQVKWAFDKSKQHQSLIILTQGNVMQLMRDNKTRIYFDQNGYLIKTFNIQNLPAEVYQEEDILKIREVAI
ncbi:MAG: type-F conjugative transfer system protein TraW [Proteobacteria bacterium]|nr:type-F conjugative transfer system protein TraW [Pseudomonadota bacterium]